MLSQLWKTEEKRIGNNNSRTAIKRRADFVQLANMIERGGTDGGDVTLERNIVVQNDSRVATGRNV